VVLSDFEAETFEDKLTGGGFITNKTTAIYLNNAPPISESEPYVCAWLVNYYKLPEFLKGFQEHL